ncbi:MAG TPA: preprotein translocase subunit SecE [Clostridiales bacterium]|nr:preprotein translocase subunit SecE [Clostridiales bacterium]
MLAKSKAQAQAQAKSKAAARKKSDVKFGTRIKSFFRGVWAELKNVHWPTKKQVLIYTGVVLVTIAAVMVMLWIVDSILSIGIEGLLGLFD